MDGMDVSVDILTADTSLLYSEDRMNIFLDLLINKIGMTYAGMSQTQSGTFPNIVHPNEQAGVSVQKLLIESHVCVHTFPERYHAHLVISSCKNFNTMEVYKLAKNVFNTEKICVRKNNWGFD